MLPKYQILRSVLASAINPLRSDVLDGDLSCFFRTIHRTLRISVTNLLLTRSGIRDNIVTCVAILPNLAVNAPSLQGVAVARQSPFVV